MAEHRILLSLVTNDNDYQQAQAEAARTAAAAKGFQIDIQFSENDAVLQVQRILNALQAKERLYDGILTEPVGTSMEQAARLAASKGVAWGVINHHTDYVTSLRRSGRSVLFEVTNDHYEMGRIQGQQAAALLPSGGLVLYVEGPATGGAAKLRTEGMLAAKPGNVEIKTLKGDWTEASMRKNFASWLSLTTSRKLGVAAIMCQNDAMALGVRQAIEKTLSGPDRQYWLELPLTGCDGLPKGGQSLVQQGILTATIAVPPNAGIAIELMSKAFRGEQVPERSVGEAASFPPLGKLQERRRPALSAQ